MTPPNAGDAHGHGHETNSAIKWVVGIGLGLVVVALVIAGVIMFTTAETVPSFAATDPAKGFEPVAVPCPSPAPAAWKFSTPEQANVVGTAEAAVLTMVPEDCGRPRYVGVDSNGLTPWIRVDTRNGYRLATESVPLSAEWSKDLRPEDSHGYTWLRYGQVEGTTHFTSVKLTLRLVGTSAK